MRILLVFNTHAGNGSAGKSAEKIMERFKNHHIEVECVFTCHPGHAVEIVKGSELSAFDGIAAAGGDGTIFEVVNGYYSNPGNRKPPLGVIPVGTGNAFVRDIGLRTGEWKEAVDLIAGNSVKGTDVVRFTFDGNDHYFLNILGIGFVADVNRIAQKLKIFGNLSYSIGVVYKLLFLKNYRVRLEIDGRVIERDNIFVEVSNSRFTSNFLMAPAAQIDDGFLDVTLLNKTSRRRMLQSFPKIFKGDHIHMEEVETFRARRISIDTGRPKDLTPDGEMFGTSPLTIECLKRDILLFRR